MTCVTSGPLSFPEPEGRKRAQLSLQEYSVASPRGRHSRPSKTSKIIAGSAPTAPTGAFAVIAITGGTGPQHTIQPDKPAAVTQVRETAFIAPHTTPEVA